MPLLVLLYDIELVRTFHVHACIIYQYVELLNIAELLTTFLVQPFINIQFCELLKDNVLFINVSFTCVAKDIHITLL